MTAKTGAIRRLGFLTPGNYAEDQPAQGLEQALRLFAFGESLGYDSAWIRQRHLEPGVTSASVFLAAASQRTTRIEIGSAVIQLGYENTFRLAEDLAMVDALSDGRLNIGVSAGPPPFAALLGDRLVEGDPAVLDYSHNRVLRLADNLKSEPLGDDDTWITSAAGRLKPRLQPVRPGLIDRLWYGGGSRRSARWAGENGFNFLTGNLISGEETDDFFEAQLGHLDLYHEAWAQPRPPRVAIGRVIVPWDGADRATRERYRAYAAERHARTLGPQGERRTLFSRDLVGSADDILEQLAADPVIARIDDLRLELPYNFAFEDYQQILTDMAERIAPALGWSPRELSDDR